MDGRAEGMMPGLTPLNAARALVLKLRMSHLRRATCPMMPVHRTFIAEVCHRDPAVLSEAQRAHVDRLTWRYGFALPANLRLKSEPGAVATQAA